MYDSDGERIRPEDVLDREELAEYYAHPNRYNRRFITPHKSDEERQEEMEWGGVDEG